MSESTEERRMQVVRNDEEQYSLWPAGSTPPSGWYAVGVEGTETEALDHIEAVWTDMRPKSVRDALAEANGSDKG